MSNYSHALARLIADHFDGKQFRLAQTANLQHSMISRHCTGKFRPDLASLEKICASLPSELRGKLAAAHLQDELPASARYDVEVRASITEAKKIKESMPTVFDRLDRPTQEALEILAEEALDNETAREWLQGSARILQGKSFVKLKK